MGVYIKGMEMPKNCDKCKFSWWDFGHLYCEADGKPWSLEVTEYAHKRHPDCPFIEVSEDVQPVKHGKWIADGDGYHWTYNCSICGWKDGYPFNERHNFCPNCGAKMDGGHNG